MEFDPRQGDLYLFPTEQGGNIKITDGEPVMDQGLETAVYISLLGDDGTGWFGNEYLNNAQKITSQFAQFIQSNALTSASILTAEEKALQDLQWMLDEGISDDNNVTISIIDRNRVNVLVEIYADGNRISVNEFQLNWFAQKDNPASGRI